MNTTAAATQAGVTVATIRTWCRRGVIAATKQAGRWIIDTASLAARIAIGAMHTRKAKAMTEPVEVRIDDTFTIRAEQQTSPAYGTTSWYAALHTNGWKTGFSFEGSTAQEAIDRALRDHNIERAQSARLEELEDAGILADLSTGYTGGMHAQLGSLTREPRATRRDECPTCGLDRRTCDCR
jgi:hypothetical protein